MVGGDGDFRAGNQSVSSVKSLWRISACDQPNDFPKTNRSSPPQKPGASNISCVESPERPMTGWRGHPLDVEKQIRLILQMLKLLLQVGVLHPGDRRRLVTRIEYQRTSRFSKWRSTIQKHPWCKAAEGSSANPERHSKWNVGCDERTEGRKGTGIGRRWDITWSIPFRQPACHPRQS